MNIVALNARNKMYDFIATFKIAPLKMNLAGQNIQRQRKRNPTGYYFWSSSRNGFSSYEARPEQITLAGFFSSYKLFLPKKEQPRKHWENLIFL